jgi:hypothetical protein
MHIRALQSPGESRVQRRRLCSMPPISVHRGCSKRAGASASRPIPRPPIRTSMTRPGQCAKPKTPWPTFPTKIIHPVRAVETTERMRIMSRRRRAGRGLILSTGIPLRGFACTSNLPQPRPAGCLSSSRSQNASLGFGSASGPRPRRLRQRERNFARRSPRRLHRALPADLPDL